MRRAGTVLGIVVVVGACSGNGGQRAPAPAEQQLGAGIAASVGGEKVPLSMVERIARAQGVEPAKARTLAVRDALFARAAREQLSPATQRAAERGVLARALLEGLEREARAEGPPSDQEIAKLTKQRWTELDRPPSARTVHAVVRTKDGKPNAAAKAAAERVAKAVAGIDDPEAFLEAARGVDTGDFELRAEALPAVTADGRVVNLEQPRAPQQRFDERFARAANAIESEGQLSPVVESDFGYHVILLVERIPFKRVPLAERRTMLADEVFAARAKQRHDRLLERLRQRTQVIVSRAVDDWTRRVEVQR